MNSISLVSATAAVTLRLCRDDGDGWCDVYDLIVSCIPEEGQKVVKYRRERQGEGFLALRRYMYACVRHVPTYASRMYVRTLYVCMFQAPRLPWFRFGSDSLYLCIGVEPSIGGEEKYYNYNARNTAYPVCHFSFLKAIARHCGVHTFKRIGRAHP
ncbi:hypothetical protein GGR53DRAFT_134733 [Hypoxylon sp. FL1150]|nr:hypothetical protein GGR53DRAFT_134733 [Hypoxylon sp. FL1150]